MHLSPKMDSEADTRISPNSKIFLIFAIIRSISMQLEKVI